MLTGMSQITSQNTYCACVTTSITSAAWENDARPADVASSLSAKNVWDNVTHVQCTHTRLSPCQCPYNLKVPIFKKPKCQCSNSWVKSSELLEWNVGKGTVILWRIVPAYAMRMGKFGIRWYTLKFTWTLYWNHCFFILERPHSLLCVPCGKNFWRDVTMNHKKLGNVPRSLSFLDPICWHIHCN